MATSTEAKVLNALKTHLLTLTFSPELPIAPPNVDFTPPADGSAYIEIVLIQNGTIDYAVGPESDVIQGILQATVLAPQGTGLEDGQDIAGQIKDHFAKGLVLWESGVRVLIDGAPSISGPIPDKPRVRFPVSINYQATTI